MSFVRSAQLSRRSLLGGLGATAVAFGLTRAPSAAGATGLPLVVEGAANAVVVVPDAADPQVTAAATTLISTIAASTGVTLPRLTESADTDTTYPGWTRIRLRVASDQDTDELSRQARSLPADGYVIAPSLTAVTVIAASPWGTRFGAYALLTHVVGAEWIMPGPSGADIPARTSLDGPASRILSAPAFASRQLYPLGIGNTWDSTNVPAKWGAQNRMHETRSYSHNLSRIFSPAVYGDPQKPETYRPEFYPLRGGVPYIPPATTATGWQPRLTVPETVDVAAQAAISAFAADPERRAFSLGINDSGGFSEDEYELSGYDEFGLRSLSNVYYAWVNAVAEKVAVSCPDRLLGLIAYNEVAAPPDFDLHPNVMPYLCRDRYGWVDPGTKAADLRRHDAWQRRASTLGWYDYAYGAPYPIPRIAGAALQEAYAYAAGHDVQGVFAELAPNWGDGPKAWMFSKLLWDPNLDATALLEEWCQRAVGPAAASDLTGYFHAWEAIWTDRVPATEWFGATGGSTYFPFYQADFIDVIEPAEMAQQRQRLERVVLQADSAPRKARAEILQRAFSYYEASVLSFPRATPPPADAMAASALLDDVTGRLDDAVAFAIKRGQLIDEFAADPLLRHSTDARKVGMNWSGWNLPVLWQLAEFIQCGGPAAAHVRTKAGQLAESTASANVKRYAEMLLQVADGEVTTLGTNTRFASGDIAPWLIESSEPPREPAVVTTEHGRHLLRVAGGFRSGGISQAIAVGPGLIRHHLRYRVTAAAGSGGAMQLTWYLLNAAGGLVQLYRGRRRQLSDTGGRWTDLAGLEMLPAGVTSAKLYVSFLGIPAGTTVDFDRIEFNRLA
ncbi:DUF4838 domain-containing protein [Kribbella solani]|uniref:DUF4838 domain-containing protein n=1 Tax=Kribbella solani TaxID=236067 RepID=UPI0029ABC432|nr:DUF4838 domain-containing protein [Kribbella solani]MDX3006632.1 DUF4838 domain-containing protein [Kribbella solani]